MYARSDGTIENTNLYPGLSTANPTVDDFMAYYTSPNMLQNIARFGTPQELVNMARMSQQGGETWVPTITSGNWQYNPVYGVNAGMMSTPQPAAGMGLAYGQQPSGTSRLGTLPSTGWGGAGSTKETAKSTYSYSGGNQGAASEVMSAIFAAALPEAPSQRRYFESYMSPIWSEFIYNYLKGGGLPGRSNAYMREGGGAVNAGDYSQWSTLGANEQESMWSEWIKNYPFADEFYSRTAKERGSSPQHSEFSPRTNWIGF
jgi:hypothetical protein